LKYNNLINQKLKGIYNKINKNFYLNRVELNHLSSICYFIKRSIKDKRECRSTDKK